MQRIGVARTMPISMSYPLLASVLAVALLGERVTPGLLGGLLLIPLGLLLLTLPSGRVVVPDADAGSLRAGVALAAGAALCWAISAVMIRPALDQVDVLPASVIRTTAGAASVWLVGWRLGRLDAWRMLHGPRLQMVFVGGIVPAFSGLFSLYAVQHAGVARQATLAATAPLYGVPLSALALKEQVTRRMALGTLITVIGVALVIGA
jgi:DME family drug/metabolite transporter